MDISVFSTNDSIDVHAASRIVPSIETIQEALCAELAAAHLPETLSSGAVVVQGCLPLLMNAVSAEAIIERVGPQKYARIRKLYKESSLLNLWYGLELQKLLQILGDAQIPVMVLKGADLAATFYSRTELRHFGDVDLLVKPDHLMAVAALLEQAGYQYHQEYRFEAISKQRVGFVYVKAVAAGYLAFEVHTSPHSNEMGVSFDAAQWWQRARPIVVANVTTLGMGLEDLLLYLCWHYRSHAFSRLIWLYDIAVVVSGAAEQLDWSLLAHLARQQGLSSTIYYCLRWCQQLFHVSLPAHNPMHYFEPSKPLQWLMNYAIVDDVAPLVHRHMHYKRKLLQRLMADNVPALCRILLRLLFPSPTHLGRLYMERYSLPVHLFWLYYPVHPFFVLASYLKRRGRND